MGKLFGTDGIRGLANIELTPEMAFKIGRVGAAVLARACTCNPAFLVARDTRISGPMLEAALVAGLTSAGADVSLAGVISTPAAAYLTRHSPFNGGVIISASHNPYPDNGIKFISGDGFKLPDDVEAEMEYLYHQPQDSLPRPREDKVGRVYTLADAASRYAHYLVSTVPCRFDGYRIVLDCANGAACNLAPAVFRALGAEVITLYDSPDGTNINDSCGSTHPDAACTMVRKYGAHLGFAFDGDADRVLAVDEHGRLVDGDAIMAILALAMREKGNLSKNTLVTTVMSNIGLEKAAAAHNINLMRTRVGDRYVLEEMLAGGYNLGGEQSGHIILLDHSTTGDGLLTALQLTATMVQKQKTLSELASVFTRYPQVLLNCRVRDKEGLNRNQRVTAAIAEAEKALAGAGRLLVRPSGTEPLVRIMLEGQNEDQLHILAEGIAKVVAEELS